MIGYVTPPRGNIFADLGFEPEEAESLFVRAKLMHEMSRLIEERRLKRRSAATLFSVSLQCVDDLKRGKMNAFQSTRS
jgi:predicted XRE-type DNA-binding protein